MGGDLDISRCKEEFSVAYVHAIAAAAGYAMERRTVDAYGVDLEVINRSFRIDVQMKCTNETEDPKPVLPYQLDARTYNFLADPERNVPGFLFVVEVPADQSKWLTVGRDRLSMLRLGYYQEMRGLDTTTQGSKVVHLDRKHRLTVDSLSKIMVAAKAGLPVHPVKQRGPCAMSELMGPGGLPAVSMNAVLAYLRSAGWEQDTSPTELPVQFWHRAGNEVMVPLHVEAPDFARRWWDLVGDLASAQERRPDEVDRDLSVAQYDVLELRAEQLQADVYTIPLADGVELITNAKALVVSAACSTLDRRSYHGKSRPKAALDQARTVRMGQTRRGSYVIPIISPVADPEIAARDAEEPSLLPEVERELFPRRVMATMATALVTLHELGVQAALEPTIPTLTEAVVRGGLSAELCASVANMAAARDVSNLTLGMRWSLIASAPSIGNVSVDFPKEASSSVRRIGERLRAQVVVNEHIIYGVVTSLDRDPEDSEGTITIRALINRRVRPIKVTLADPDYHVATQAHDEKRRIVVSGSLVNLSGHTLRMTDIRFFQFEELLDLPVGGGDSF